jgi:hypothetical protein
MRLESTPRGTSTTTCEGVVERMGTGVLPMRTELAGDRFWPERITLVPAAPLGGENEVTMGGWPAWGMTEKAPRLEAVPLGPETVMGPLVAPGGTSAMSRLSVTTVTAGDSRPLKSTYPAPVKPEPVTVTRVPGVPLPGEKPRMESTAPSREEGASWRAGSSVGIPEDESMNDMSIEPRRSPELRPRVIARHRDDGTL